MCFMEATSAPCYWRASSQSQGIERALKTENSEEQRPPVEICGVSLDMKTSMMLSRKPEYTGKV